MARPHYGNFNNGNMQSMMRQVQKMQQQLTEAQNKLEEQEFTGEGGGGMVSISMTGAKAVTNVKVDNTSASGILGNRMSTRYRILQLLEDYMHNLEKQRGDYSDLLFF